MTVRYFAGLVGATMLLVGAGVAAGLRSWPWFGLLAVCALWALILWVGTALGHQIDRIAHPPAPDLQDEGPRYIGDRYGN